LKLAITPLLAWLLPVAGMVLRLAVKLTPRGVAVQVKVTMPGWNWNLPPAVAVQDASGAFMHQGSA